MSYQKVLSPQESRRLIPAANGRPLVRINRNVRLVTGEVLYANERYPLREVEITNKGPVAVIHWRTKQDAALDTYIRLLPADFSKIEGEDYWVIPVWNKGTQTNKRLNENGKSLAQGTNLDD